MELPTAYCEPLFGSVHSELLWGVIDRSWRVSSGAGPVASSWVADSARPPFANWEHPYAACLQVAECSGHIAT